LDVEIIFAGPPPALFDVDVHVHVTSNRVPSMVSQFVSPIKETSLGYVISVQEFTYSANQLNNNLLTEPFSVFAILALTYFVICFILTQFTRRLELRIHNKRQGPSRQRSSQNDFLLQSE